MGWDYLFADPEPGSLEGSLMLQPPAASLVSDFNMPGAIPSIGPEDFTPAGDVLAAAGALQNRDMGALGLALASLFLPGTIRPVSTPKAYLPDLVQAAQRRVVEPVVPAADQAVYTTISPEAKRMFLNGVMAEPVGFEPTTTALTGLRSTR